MAKRRDLFDPTDPSRLQSEERLTEVAAILAAGMIRMREQRAVTVPKVRSCRNAGDVAEYPHSAPPKPRSCERVKSFLERTGKNLIRVSFVREERLVFLGAETHRSQISMLRFGYGIPVRLTDWG